MVPNGMASRKDPSNTWKFSRKMWCSLPSCLLCALPIVEDWINGDGPTKLEMDADQARWKTYDDSAKKHMLVPSAEVERTIFHKQPQIWRALYRGILVEPDQRHRLTGITVFDGDWGVQKFPRSPHQARIGSRLDSIFMPKYAANLLEELGAARVTSPEGPDPYWPPAERPGYLVHAHCWALFGQVVEGGVARIEENLDVFVQAAQHFWQKDRLRETHAYKTRWCIPRDIPAESDSSSLSYCEMEKRALHTARASCQNPLFVLKLEEAIQRNRKRRKVHLHVGLGNFPLDLAILVIDTVIPAKYTAIEVQNARNLLEAFQWTLPDGYWRKRCDSSLLFEVKVLEKTKTQMDWQALGLDLMGLLVEDEFTSGLRNRERILLFMDHIKKRFIEFL
ncbi:hypothetical protein N7516_000653 [Penicillium verrucosum]|uniref:uncharacterized protein n=1 Tax=Penicillium verrucosum TaxID=60171 RepID=UPI002545AAB5|nr:uncharacterized protein N7516_000653 [Penicillium verrucosum]KAJ5940485.1 hypothetical protein N7516_000653 [Penicillium verrucosum]